MSDIEALFAKPFIDVFLPLPPSTSPYSTSDNILCVLEVHPPACDLLSTHPPPHTPLSSSSHTFPQLSFPPLQLHLPKNLFLIILYLLDSLLYNSSSLQDSCITIPKTHPPTKLCSIHAFVNLYYFDLHVLSTKVTPVVEELHLVTHQQPGYTNTTTVFPACHESLRKGME